jgi:hypothetical protein
MATQVHRNREDAEVIAWRRAQLAYTGFPQALAVLLASDSCYDLHALIELVERGCPPDLAVRILAPLEANGNSVAALLPSNTAS